MENLHRVQQTAVRRNIHIMRYSVGSCWRRVCNVNNMLRVVIVIFAAYPLHWDDCWTATPDVHGLGGVFHHKFTFLIQCQLTCIYDEACVAIDWDPRNPWDELCWILTTTPTGPTLDKGLVTHYELNRHCIAS